MGSHRGERRARRRTPDPGSTSTPRRSHRGGSRRSIPDSAPSKPEPVISRPEPVARESVRPEPVLRSTLQAQEKPRGGARKATRKAVSSPRPRLLPALSSKPTIAGATVVALAATGALTLGRTPLPGLDTGGLPQLAAQSNLAGGVRAVAAGSGRQQRPSRDATRAALQDAQNRQLVAAADEQAQERTATLNALAASAQRHARALAWHLPIAAGSYELTAGFGETSGLWATVHTGLDFAAPTGTPIRAVASGVVTSVGWAGAYGNRTIVTLPDGTELWYCHQNGFNVQVGQHVTGGQVIGYVGATGNTTGPHLHLEVRPQPDEPVDPYQALLDHGVQP